MQILLAVIGALAALMMAVFIGACFWVVWHFYRVLRDLRNQLSLMNSTVGALPGLVEGVRNVCVELAGNTVSMTKSVEVFRKGLLDETSESRRPGVLPYDDNEAERAWEAQRVAQNEGLLDIEGSRFIVGE